MGISWKELTEGVLDTGKVIAETMALWNQATSKDTTPAGTAAPAPVVSNVPAAQAMQMDATQWALVIGALVLFALLVRR